MKITSKIKTLFQPQTLHDLAAVCDTRRIASNIEKMKLVMKILVRQRDDVLQIGGATNRLVVQIEGYIVKVALDSQGYEDNLMEFSLAEELIGDTTKTYETNGYLLVAQLARLMTRNEWYERKGDILRKLEHLSKDYLLGDVGYTDLNRTNWGVLDNDDVVILDYAYIHRATEKLFTCPDCKDGTLTYDQFYTQLMCSNMAHCKAKFTYSEMKKIQGSEVDERMITEKLSTSIVLKGDQTTHEIQRVHNGDLVDSSTVVIHNNIEYERFMQEEQTGRIDDPITWEDFDSFQKMQQEAACSDNPNEIYMIWMQKRKAAKPVKRKWVLSDDFYEISKDPIHPKWVGMEFDETHEEFIERMKQQEDEKKKEAVSMLDLTRRPSQFGGGISFIAEESINPDMDTTNAIRTDEGVFCGDPKPDMTGNDSSRNLDLEEDSVFLGIKNPGRKQKGKVFLGQRTSKKSMVERTAVDADRGASREVREAIERYTSECAKLNSIIYYSFDEDEVNNAMSALEELKAAGYERFLDEVKVESDGKNNYRRGDKDQRNRKNGNYPGYRRDQKPQNADNSRGETPRNRSAEPASSPSEQDNSTPSQAEENPNIPDATVVPARKSKYGPGTVLYTEDTIPVKIQSVAVDGKEV